jgi:hypothetical protein
MDFFLRPIHPPQTESDDPYIAFLAALTDEERAVVDQEAIALTRRLVQLIVTHSHDHPDVSNMVWLHAVSALFETWQGMARELAS